MQIYPRTSWVPRMVKLSACSPNRTLLYQKQSQPLRFFNGQRTYSKILQPYTESFSDYSYAPYSTDTHLENMALAPYSHDKHFANTANYPHPPSPYIFSEYGAFAIFSWRLNMAQPSITLTSRGRKCVSCGT